MPKTQSASANSITPLNGLAEVLPNAPVLSSKQAAWNSILVEQYQHPLKPRENELLPLSNHWLTFNLGQSARLVQKRDGRTYEGLLRAGEHTVIPAGQPSYWRCNGGIDILHIHLDTAFVAQTAEASNLDANRIEIVNCFSGFDSQIQHIALSLLAEIKSSGLMGALYVETLTTLLIVHLLRHYSAFGSKVLEPDVQHLTGSGLSKSKLQRVIEYIHDNLDQELTLAEIATVVDMSPGYFATLFKESTKLAPHQYVIQSRVERAKQLLLRGGLSISQVAMDVGFCDQSHLTRHMRRLLGVTPKTLLKTQ